MPKKQESFEVSLAKLEEIVERLEKGESDLDEMLKLYEEGISLIRICNAKLTQAEQSVKMLSMQADGSVALTDFDIAEES